MPGSAPLGASLHAAGGLLGRGRVCTEEMRRSFRSGQTTRSRRVRAYPYRPPPSRARQGVGVLAHCFPLTPHSLAWRRLGRTATRFGGGWRRWGRILRDKEGQHLYLLQGSRRSRLLRVSACFHLRGLSAGPRLHPSREGQGGEGYTCSGVVQSSRRCAERGVGEGGARWQGGGAAVISLLLAIAKYPLSVSRRVLEFGPLDFLASGHAEEAADALGIARVARPRWEGPCSGAAAASPVHVRLLLQAAYLMPVRVLFWLPARSVYVVRFSGDLSVLRCTRAPFRALLVHLVRQTAFTLANSSREGRGQSRRGLPQVFQDTATSASSFCKSPPLCTEMSRPKAIPSFTRPHPSSALPLPSTRGLSARLGSGRRLARRISV